MFVTAVLRVGALGAVLATTATMLADHSWYAELATHFRLHYVIGSIAALLLALGLRFKFVSLVFAVTVLLHGAYLMPYIVSPDPVTAHGDIVVLQANVLTDNVNYASVAAAIETRQPSLVVLQETDAAWVEAIQQQVQGYPYQKSIPRPDNFGMMILSRLPTTTFRVLEPGQDQVPAVALQFRLNNRVFHWLAQHTVPPMSPSLAERRNRQLQGSADWLRQQSGNHALIGDLNVSPFSPNFRALLARANLHDPRRRHGYLATWPQALGPLGIPIDHILVGPKLQVIDLARVPIDGSDHGGLLATIEIVD